MIATKVDNFDIRRIQETVVLAKFTLWILIKDLGVEEVVNSRMAYEYLKGKYPNITVNYKQFSDALRRSSKKFSQTNDGLYFLTQEAEQEIEKVIND